MQIREIAAPPRDGPARVNFAGNERATGGREIHSRKRLPTRRRNVHTLISYVSIRIRARTFDNCATRELFGNRKSIAPLRAPRYVHGRPADACFFNNAGAENSSAHPHLGRNDDNDDRGRGRGTSGETAHLGRAVVSRVRETQYRRY